jgi:hypothetical protein
MITFIKPENLNGTELRAELNAAGVVISNAPESVTIDENGNLVLDIAEIDKDKATPVVDAHNGTTQAVDRTTEKQEILDQLGITAEQAKLLLS